MHLTNQIIRRVYNILQAKKMFFQQVEMLVNSFQQYFTL